MKTEIIIKEGRAKVVLLAESEFEKDLIEKIVESKVGYDTKTTVETKNSYHTHTDHRIEINLIEKQKH